MSKMIDMSNKDFGYWHVIERGPNNKSGQAMWLCECALCGNKKIVSGKHLRSGASTNCGCLRNKNAGLRNKKDEAGKTYGCLYVEREAYKEEKPQRADRTGIYWNCTCTKCGRKNVIVKADYLRKGDTKSCGCINSVNESKICKMLDTLGFQYKTQISFKNLFSGNQVSNKLYFDIGIYNGDKLIYLIEYDGIQHFENGHFKNTFIQTHKNDLNKNKYCFENNIPLIRIPYDEEYILNDLKLETTRFLLTLENEKEYYESRIKDE